MTFHRYLLAALGVLSCLQSATAQQISKEELIFLTPEWKGERFADGRPRVSDDILERMKNVTLDDAWVVLREHNFHHQYDDGWMMINPDGVLVGRAVTAIFVPGRPDLHRAIDEKARKQDGRIGPPNLWAPALLVPGDVYVVDQFGAHEDGPTLGGVLGNSIHTKSGNGVVYNGAIRDIDGLEDIGTFTAFVRGYHPSHQRRYADGSRNIALIGINQPTRIGKATAMPGDVVLGRQGGVMFIPPHLAELVVKRSEVARLRDMFGLQRVREQAYTPAQVDSRWSEDMEQDFSQWLTDHIDELPFAREQIQEYVKTRTW